MRPLLAPSAPWYHGLCAAVCALEVRQEQQQALGNIYSAFEQQLPAAVPLLDADTPPRRKNRVAAERQEGSAWPKQVIRLGKLKLPCQCGSASVSIQQHRRLHQNDPQPHNHPFPEFPVLPPELRPLPPPPQLQQVAKELSSGGVSIRIDTGRSGAVDVKIPALSQGSNGATPQPAGQQSQQQNGSPAPRAGVTLTELGVGPSPTKH